MFINITLKTFRGKTEEKVKPDNRQILRLHRYFNKYSVMDNSEAFFNSFVNSIKLMIIKCKQEHVPLELQQKYSSLVRDTRIVNYT